MRLVRLTLTTEEVKNTQTVILCVCVRVYVCVKLTLVKYDERIYPQLRGNRNSIEKGNPSIEERRVW